MKLDDNITVLKNLGEARYKIFSHAGINTIGELISFLPRDYEDRSIISPVSDMEAGFFYTIETRVVSTPKNNGFRGTVATSAVLGDDSGKIEAVWFNQPYMKTSLVKGEVYRFSGKAILRGKSLQLQSPDFEKLTSDSPNTGRIIPIYPSVVKLSQKLIRGYIKQALEIYSELIEESLPLDILSKNGLLSRKEAICNIHFPKSNKMFLKSRQRLVFEELFIFQAALFTIKGNIQKEKTDIVISVTDYSGLELPFKLTEAQASVMADIIKDFNDKTLMYRLIQGDVGSGKTIIAIIAAYIAIQNGFQAALMAPTEVLASQHYLSFTRLFDKCGIPTCLVTGSMKASEKKAAYELISSGGVKMIIGTHALIQDKVVYNNLGLVITDEQHRFGVNQRAGLSDKGNKPHVLVMSATPIPRSLALVLYGDMDISVIDKLPPGRQEISTYALDSTYRKRAYNFIDLELEKGRQAYIICPSIEDGQKLDIANVMDYAAAVKNEYLVGRTVGVLHGKMPPKEKQKVMDDFYAGDISVLVSTTVIEVGINNANATIMVIENAERFGLSQLHQLRGRVGRGSEKSYCMLFSDSTGKIAKERLIAMTKTTDGFEISELDLKLRGPGDFFGTRQHGLPEMKIADIIKDAAIIPVVRKAVTEYLNDGANEQNRETEILNHQISKYIEYANRGF